VGEKSGVVGKVVHYYWIIESAKKWIMECVNEQVGAKKSGIYATSKQICLSTGNDLATDFLYSMNKITL